jgi:nitronate monooxygenase
MVKTNSFLQQLQMQHPIIQAPLAGGGDTPELVAEVCNAGAVGFVGAAYLTAQQIAATCQLVRNMTARPFGINLFAPQTQIGNPTEPEAALSRVATYFTELGLPAPALPTKAAYTFEEQLAAALEAGASAFSFTFGILPEHAIRSIKNRGMYLLGTATTVDEAVQLEKAGIDAIVAQGSEAGGHRGTFSGDFSSCMVGTIALVPQIVDAVRVPVIASGGIMDGRGIVAALALGASAVQLGTAFLICNESGVSKAYREAILQAHEDQTRITRAFSGRPARGIVNRFMTEVESGNSGNCILPFPLQNALTRPLRTAAAKQGRAEFLSLWSGQGLRMARQQSAAELVARLVNETAAVLRGLQERTSQSSRPSPYDGLVNN